jgi:hypothetical protein
MNKKIDFIKLKNNIKIENKIENLVDFITKITEKNDLDSFFMSFEFTLFVINFVVNDFGEKYKYIDKKKVSFTIIEKIFKNKFDENSEYNESYKKKILTDINTIFDEKIYKVISKIYVYTFNLFNFFFL